MKPILFSTPMVRALLDGRKTMTRRVAKMPENTYRVERNDDGTFDAIWGAYMPQINGFVDGSIGIKPKYIEGDILWVRETWTHDDYEGFVDYKADCTDNELEELKADGIKWRPSIYMPKEASRIFLQVTNVRVERVRDISEEEAIEEGIRERILNAKAYELNGGKKIYNYADGSGTTYSSKEAFTKLWNSTVKKTDLDKYGWQANPWVWVYTFERCEKPGGEEQ